MNRAEVTGTVTTDPAIRDVMGATWMTFDIDAGGHSVPVRLVDPPARHMALTRGSRVDVVGHVERRYFRVGGATQSRTEVVGTIRN